MEETLSDFIQRNNPPAYIEGGIWNLIKRGEPFTDGELVDLKDYSRENIAYRDGVA
jgi:hypothetical protein